MRASTLIEDLLWEHRSKLPSGQEGLTAWIRALGSEDGLKISDLPISLVKELNFLARAPLGWAPNRASDYGKTKRHLTIVRKSIVLSASLYPGLE